MPKPKATHNTNDSGEFVLTEEEYNELLDDIQTAETRVTELEDQLKARVDPDKVDEEVERLTEQIRESEEELTELRNELTESESKVEEIDVAVISLREDALDAFATAAGLTKYDRDTDEKYIAFKSRVDATDSILSLIRTRKHYSMRHTATDGRRSMRETDSDKVEEAPKPFGYSSVSALNQ